MMARALHRWLNSITSHLSFLDLCKIADLKLMGRINENMVKSRDRLFEEPELKKIILFYFIR